MNNDFDFFEGATTESASAASITVRRGGHLVLSRAAVAMLGEGVTHVQLGFNAKTGAVGIRPATEEVRGRYRLRSQKNNVSYLVDGKRFFAHHGLELGKARSFEALDLNGLIGFYLNGRNEDEAPEPGPTEPPATTEKPELSRRKTKAA